MTQWFVRMVYAVAAPLVEKLSLLCNTFAATYETRADVKRGNRVSQEGGRK